MPPKPYEHIPEDVLKEAAEEKTGKEKPKEEKPEKQKKNNKGSDNTEKENNIPKESRQRRLIKKKRAGVVLTREEVKAIKEGRKKLRKEMKERGIKSKREFEMVAGSLGLYFDKTKYGLLAWLGRHWLGTLIASLIAFIIVLMLFSAVTQMRGLYTVNLSDDMFREGFTLSETYDFANPAVELFAEPAQNVPCVSIRQIPANVDDIDGVHNKEYFAYTYYLKNEGASSVDFDWELQLNSESKGLSTAVWVALFIDGELNIYAMPNTETGNEEVLPPYVETGKGYINVPLIDAAPNSPQFEVVKQLGNLKYYRVIPFKFETSDIIASGRVTSVIPNEIHKFTVVIWIEGDDVDADNSKIGGHLGTQMNFRLAGELGGSEGKGFKQRWNEFWKNLKFW